MDEEIITRIDALKKCKQKPSMITRRTVGFNGFVSNAILEFNKGIKENYNLLIVRVGDQNIKSSQIIELYQECIVHAHLLNKHHAMLIKALLQVRWMEREEEVMNHFRDFVTALVTTNPVHLHAIMTSLTRTFIYQGVEIEGVQREESVDTSYVFETAHKVLKTIFSMIPQSFLVAETVFKSCFPFRTKPLCSLTSYMKNLLLVTKYQRRLRPIILKDIFRHLVQLDVHTSREAIEESELEDDERKEEDIFQLDEDLEKIELSSSPAATHMKHEHANKLDHLLEIFYQFIHEECYQDGKLLLAESRQLFREIIPAFDKILLPVYQLNHVQFAIFYMCSFKAGFYDTYIDNCWKLAKDSNTSSIFRKNAACYIASFLARAKYVPLSTAKASLETMSAWCHQYLKRVMESDSPTAAQCDPKRHGPFYSICQGILYVIVFRHRQILESERGREYIQSLNLQNLIVSSLNPLKVCLTSVVSLFASTMRTHQIVYCDSIIKRNNRQVVPKVGSLISDESQTNPLGSFFPFDPYLLKRSASYIKPLYIEWTGSVPTNTKDVEDSHDDEFLDAVEEGSLAMSVKETDMVGSLAMSVQNDLPSMSPDDFEFLP